MSIYRVILKIYPRKLRYVAAFARNASSGIRGFTPGIGLITNARVVGAHLMEGAGAIPAVVGLEGRGLLLGLRLDRPAAEVQRALFGRRVLTGLASDPAVLRLLPPLVLSRREADLLLAALREVLV